MPTLNIATNLTRDQIPADFLENATDLLSSELGKPKQYILIQVNPDQMMSFGGTQEPCANISLGCIGVVSPDKNKELAPKLSKFIETSLGIKQDRQLLKSQPDNEFSTSKSHRQSRKFPSEIAQSDLGVNKDELGALDKIFSEVRYPQTFDNVTQVINMCLYWKMRTTWFRLMMDGLWVNDQNDTSAFDTIEYNLSSAWNKYIATDWDKIASRRGFRSDDDTYGQIQLDACEDTSSTARSLFDIHFTLDSEYEEDGVSTQCDFDNEDGNKPPNEVSVCNFVNFSDTKGYRTPLADILMKPEVQLELEQIAADCGLKKPSISVPAADLNVDDDLATGADNVDETKENKPTLPQPIYHALVLVHDIMEKRWIDGDFLHCLIKADKKFHGKKHAFWNLQQPRFRLYTRRGLRFKKC